MKILRLSAAAVMLVMPLCLAEPVRAQTASASILVTATVLKLCTVTALPLVFGNYSPTINLDVDTSLVVLCTPGTPFTVGLGVGAGTGATTLSRQLTGTLASANVLNYGLYRDSLRTLNWGNVIGGSADVLAGTGTVLPQTIPVYGRIPLGQTVPADVYTDTVSVTLTY